MDGARLPPDPDPKPTCLEHLQHRGVLRQHIRTQLLEPGLPGKSREMAHQGRADALPLVSIVYDEGHLGFTGPHHDVAPPADDDRLPILLENGDQGDVIHEVDVDEEVDLPICEPALEREETAVQGLLACPVTAASRPVRSSGLRARISTVRPSRRISVAE